MSKMFQKFGQNFGQNFDPSKPSKSKDRAVLSWGIWKKKCQNVVKTLTPLNPLNQKIHPFQVGAFKKKMLSKMFQKFGQNFDPSKPSKSKDTAVLSWGI